MAQSYTPDDLILFIYNELSEEDNFKIRQAIDTDAGLNSQYQAMLQVVASLDSLNFEPHPSSVEIVLEHSHHEEHFH